MEDNRARGRALKEERILHNRGKKNLKIELIQSVIASRTKKQETQKSYGLVTKSFFPGGK